MSEAKTINQLLDKMWNDYVAMNPQAQKIVDLIESTGDKVINDHIALRTFDLPKVCIDELAKPFLASGYKEAGDYEFPEKKLFAKHYHHEDEMMPKIFISQLLTQNFSTEFQNKVKELVDQVDTVTVSRFDFTSMGRPWSLSHADYEQLKKESDYAAWVGAIGYRPNHFTVYINHLNKYSDIRELNKFLKDNGYKLNDSGGEIKGSKEVFLEQSSTLADSVEVEFTDKKVSIPSCYFEFAKRYEQPDGTLYQGFVAKSADKIFESTDKSQ
jgi:hypothetical protein